MAKNTTNGTIRTIGALIASSRYLVLLVLLGLAVHLVLPQLTSLERALQVIKTLVLWAVALAVVAQALSYLGSGYLLREIVALTHQRFSLVKGVTITLASSSIGVVAGGMVGTAAATYRWMRGMDVSSEGATLAGILPLLFNNVILILAAIFGLIHLLIVHQLSPIQSISFSLIVLLLGAGLGGAVWGVRHRSESTALAVRVTSRWARIRRRPYTSTETENAMARLFDAWDALHRGGWRGPALGAALNTGFDMLTLYFLFFAAAVPIGPGALLAGYGLPLLFGKMAFFLPGGVGVVEGTMAALYTGLGVPAPAVVVVILTYRLFSFWIPTLLGFPIAAYFQHAGEDHEPSLAL
jgi:uncharacterized membrane protein YbhN (UPF0104 family)